VVERERRGEGRVEDRYASGCYDQGPDFDDLKIFISGRKIQENDLKVKKLPKMYRKSTNCF
jgi:hypothetical protein